MVIKLSKAIKMLSIGGVVLFLSSHIAQAQAQTQSRAPIQAQGPTPAQRSILVLLDASGSMINPLPSGPRKLDAAKSAVEKFATGLPTSTRVALRAYGHQSAESRKDCRDTELLSDFESLSTAIPRIATRMERLQARGYSPISFALRRAITDFEGEQTTAQMIVLVSDGKETCSGDPCATARALKRNHPNLVLHTIGFSVGGAARQQLRCVAKAGGGRYHDAKDATELADQLGRAYAFVPPLRQRIIVITAPEPGTISVVPTGEKHLIREAESGTVLTALGPARQAAPVPPGIYNVTFGNGVWKSVEVLSGNDTRLQPGTLEIVRPSVLGHAIVDPDTKEVIGEVTTRQNKLVLVPDTVHVRFGQAVWRDVQIENGKATILTPGIVRIVGARLRGLRMPNYPVSDLSGSIVTKLSLSHPEMPLPPGRYQIDILGRQLPISLSEGQVVELRVQ